MKFHLMAAAAALTLFAGSAVAQEWTEEQDMMFRDTVTQASDAGGELIPRQDTEAWEVGATVPNEYESTPLEMEGTEGYSYVRDEENYYIMDENRAIVGMSPVKLQASGAGSETTTGVDGEPQSQPTQSTN